MNRLTANIKASPQNYSTWAILLFTALATYWMQLPAAEQQALIASYPLLKHAAPLAGLVTYLSRVLPQGDTVEDRTDHTLADTRPMDKP